MLTVREISLLKRAINCAEDWKNLYDGYKAPKEDLPEYLQFIKNCRKVLTKLRAEQKAAKAFAVTHYMAANTTGEDRLPRIGSLVGFKGRNRFVTVLAIGQCNGTVVICQDGDNIAVADPAGLQWPVMLLGEEKEDKKLSIIFTAEHRAFTPKP